MLCCSSVCDSIVLCIYTSGVYVYRVVLLLYDCLNLCIGVCVVVTFTYVMTMCIWHVYVMHCLSVVNVGVLMYFDFKYCIWVCVLAH